MAQEVIQFLDVSPGKHYCDCTLGGGGHAARILQQSAPDGRLLGLDQDPQALQQSQSTLKPFDARITLHQGNFADVLEILSEQEMLPLDGILVDLGVSSHQLDTPSRGFSLSAEGPLDMRMSPSTGSTAAELLARLAEKDLARLLQDLGEQAGSRRIARQIKRALGQGKLETTADLARVVAEAAPRPKQGRRRIHPATQTFQALRMAVNDELQCLRRFLETFNAALRPGGRVVVISFHSLEDRLVKTHLKTLASACTCPPALPVCACGHSPEVRILTKKPIRPQEQELSENPRARSARLRAAEKI